MDFTNLTDPAKFKKGHTYIQWIVAIIANSSLLTYGLQAGWISPMTKVLQSQSSPAGTPLSDNTMGLIASLMPISAMVAVPVYAFIAEKYGRKTGIMCISVLHGTTWLLKLWPSTTTIIMSRICSGMASGGCFNIIPMYTKEISQDSIRGLLGSLLIYFMTMGILIIYILGAYLDYYTILYIVVGGPFLTMLLMMMCPESPGFLVKVGKYDEAVKTIARLRGLNPGDKSVQDEADGMRKEDEYYKTLPSLSLMVILKNCAWRRAYILAVLIITVQTLSGHFAVVTYGSSILAGAGVTMDAELLSISFPAIMLVGSTVSIAVVEKIGRRVILGSSFIISVITLGCLATVLLLQYQGHSTPGWLSVLAIVASMFVYAFGILPVPYIVMTEMFNIQIRAKLLSLIVVKAWFLTFVLLFVFAPLTNAFGMYTTFYVFAGINLLGAAVVLVLMPETRGKSAEQIEAVLRDK